MNFEGKKKIALIKKTEGSGEVIKEVDVFFEVAKWYRFKIIYHEDNLQLWLQIGDMRNIEKLMDVHDMDVQRGTVGIGTEKFTDVWFDGLSVD